VVEGAVGVVGRAGRHALAIAARRALGVDAVAGDPRADAAVEVPAVLGGGGVGGRRLVVEVGGRGRAVVLVGDDDDGGESVLAQEAGVQDLRRIEGAAHGLEVALEAAAVDAEAGDAREGVGEVAAVVARPRAVAIQEILEVAGAAAWAAAGAARPALQLA